VKINRDAIGLWVMVFFSGEIVVTLTSFMFGSAWLIYWLVGQVITFVMSGLVAGMLFASKYRDEE
jgi:hypothetical protein